VPMHSGVSAALSLAYRCGGSAGIASEVSAAHRLPVSALGQTALKSPDANVLVLIASRSVAQSSLMTGGIQPDWPCVRYATAMTAGKPLSRWARCRRLPIAQYRWQRLAAVRYGNEQIRLILELG
jgi:hypothetical protein